MNINAILDYTTQILQPELFKDYCPNGLQVAGRTEIKTIVSGVTASMALLEAAVLAKADILLVHHGYFWRGESPCIVGIKQQRIAYLLAHQLNLVAYHLPLDAHPTLGNNAQLASKIGATITGYAGEHNLIAYGTLSAPISLSALGDRLTLALGRKPLLLGDLNKPIARVAWCTGGAQDYFEAAIALGVDVFISGEVSEQTYHLAQESGVAYIAAGHHATERYGVQALGTHLAKQFNLTHLYIDVDNPV